MKNTPWSGSKSSGTSELDGRASVSEKKSGTSELDGCTFVSMKTGRKAGQGMREALFYEKLDNENVRCLLCPHKCMLRPGGTGICRVRRNTGGTLYSLNYSCAASIALDPIEKKPLYHFHPGSLILSAGTIGCNFKCSWCQNWTIAHGYSNDDEGAVSHGDKGSISHEHGITASHGDKGSISHEHGITASHGDRGSISHEHGIIASHGDNGTAFQENRAALREEEKTAAYASGGTAFREEAEASAYDGVRTIELTPEGLAVLAQKYADRGSIGVAYTYNEPTVWYEFVLETSKLVKAAGLANVLVTNGFIDREPLEELLLYTDAMNIDVKAFTEPFYTRYCKGSLDHVKRTVELAAEKCHVEITTLVIPGLNDSPEEIGRLAEWLSSIDPDIVLHLSRFFPNYKLDDIGPTPRATLENARKSALWHLRHVYLGNI